MLCCKLGAIAQGEQADTALTEPVLPVLGLVQQAKVLLHAAV